MRRRRQRAFVRSVCFLLAALLLVLTLAVQKAELEREYGILSVRLASRTSLEEIERRAEDELGMRPCRADQIAEIGIEKDDAA